MRSVLNGGNGNVLMIVNGGNQFFFLNGEIKKFKNFFKKLKKTF